MKMDYLITVAIGCLVSIVVAVIIIARSTERSKSSAVESNLAEIESVHEVPAVVMWTKSSSHRIPSDPRFFNVGGRIFHKSRDCQAFLEDEEWEACTEEEAVKRGLRQCALCAKPIAFVYGHSRVYHSTTWCTDAMSQPFQMFEEEAIAKGFRKCKACQKRDESIKE
jgi:hypothetical protein